MSKTELLNILYGQKDEFIRQFGHEGLEQYNCLICLVKRGEINSLEELYEYGLGKEKLPQKSF